MKPSMFDAARDEFDGEHEAPDATLRRVLVATRKQTRSRKVVRWFVLPAAAVLTASTAYAASTGQLGTIMARVRAAMHLVEARPASAEAPAASVRVPASAPPPATASAATEVATNEPPPPPAPVEPEATPPPKAVEAAPAPKAPLVAVEVRAEVPSRTAVGAPPLAETAPPPSASATPDPYASLYEEAHRRHFIEKEPARALAAWDEYLAAAPSGRFAPEARYNRALALVRLGRVAEAKDALAPFANGTGYRKAEARALLEALARDE